MYENLLICFSEASAENVKKARDHGRKLFDMAQEQDYKTWEHNKLQDFVIIGIKAGNEDKVNSLCNTNSSHMEEELFVDTVLKPSLAVAATSIYCCVKNRELTHEDFFIRDICLKLEGLVKTIVATPFAMSILREPEYFLALFKAPVKRFLIFYEEKVPNFKNLVKLLLNTAKFYEAIPAEDARLNNPAIATRRAQLYQLNRAYHGFTCTIFVYGTLMVGERRNGLMDRAAYGGKYFLKDYGCYNVDNFPGIVKDKGAKVEGEIYFVPYPLLQVLDKYEAEGTLYERKNVVVCNPPALLSCQVYVYKGKVSGKRIEGRWSERNI